MSTPVTAEVVTGKAVADAASPSSAVLIVVLVNKYTNAGDEFDRANANAARVRVGANNDTCAGAEHKTGCEL
jgi:hypothetical protein